MIKFICTGAARHHRGNPAASIRIEKLYATPKLMSGLGALVLLKSEKNIVDQHLKETYENLMRLHPKTPKSVVCFLAGCLPGEALIDMRMFTNFGMICAQKDGVLHSHSLEILMTAKPSSRSWFSSIRDLCLQYGLPHPMKLLQSTLTKHQYKSMTTKAVVNYWEMKLRADAGPLTSLQYFHPEFMSLVHPHPIWRTSGTSPYQISMSQVQATMLSGRYRTELLCSNWSSNTSGCCQTPSCRDLNIPEDLQHILVECGSLQSTRNSLMSFTKDISRGCPEINHIVEKYCSLIHPDFVQFLLDCSVLPEVIQTQQQCGSQAILNQLFRITRTWCFCLHKARLKVLNRWIKF